MDYTTLKLEESRELEVQKKAQLNVEEQIIKTLRSNSQQPEEARRKEILQRTDQCKEIEDELLEALSCTKYWSNVRKQLKGEWHVIVSSSDTINAFVTSICPRRIFVNRGLFSVNPTEEELAMVLSHEISHLMMGHGEARADMQFYLAMGQLVLLSIIDPTGLGIVADYLAATLAEYLTASNRCVYVFDIIKHVSILFYLNIPILITLFKKWHKK